MIATVCRKKQFVSTHTTPTSMALDNILTVFGPQRRVLVLDEELSKAPSAHSYVISEVGELLDLHDRVDFVLSALEPNFIADLLIGGGSK